MNQYPIKESACTYYVGRFSCNFHESVSVNNLETQDGLVKK